MAIFPFWIISIASLLSIKRQEQLYQVGPKVHPVQHTFSGHSIDSGCLKKRVGTPSWAQGGRQGAELGRGRMEVLEKACP